MKRGKSVLTLALLLGVTATHAWSEPIDLSPIDCLSPAPDAEPESPDWYARELMHTYCSTERRIDQVQHPVVAFPAPASWNDAYRDPDRHDGVRFRFQSMTIAGLAAEVYQPCTAESCPELPEGLEAFEPPYPVVITAHGSASRKEFHWWSSQSLAEAGYMVIAFDSPGYPSAPNTSMISDVLDWMHGSENPFASDMDLDRVGASGHSAGASASAGTQGDPRISAIVTWDGGTSVSDDPAHVTPTMYHRADGGMRVPSPLPGVRIPFPRTEVPADELLASGYVTLRDKGVDTMLLAFRATTHNDWLGGIVGMGNRYAEQMAVYYNLAWFDRHLKGKLVLSGSESPAEESAERALRQGIAQDAWDRLTASEFDDSADRHNLSQGFFDPVQAATSGDPLYGGNVPYSIEGRTVADRLSYYFRSVCYVSVPDYSTGDGRPGGPVVVRADTTPDGDMKIDGCAAP